MQDIKFEVTFTTGHKVIYELDELVNECLNTEYIKRYRISTGKKDKNEVDIFIGDLLQPFYDDGEINEVVWHEESCSFRVATYLDNIHGGSFAELFFMDDIHEDCNEVIGNIYDNPELLCENH